METIIHAMKELPDTMILMMNILREMDQSSFLRMEEMKMEEEKLLSELAELGKANNTTSSSSASSSSALSSQVFDETPYLERYQKIKEEQQSILDLLDHKMKTASNVYNFLDAKINVFDNATKPYHHLYPTGEEEYLRRPKKKRKGGAAGGAGGEEEAVNTIPLGDEGVLNVDPNEPVYCICRRVQFGRMIACENTECPYEWFHFACVNLPDTFEVDDTVLWYCPECIALGKAT